MTITIGSITIEGGITLDGVGPVGQTAYTTPGTYSWIAPVDVESVCVVCVGGGGGGTTLSGSGSGGGLGWKNNIAVTPGQSYTVIVGAGGQNGGAAGDSYFINTSTVAGYGGTTNPYSGDDPRANGGGYVGDGGGNGGKGAGTGDFAAVQNFGGGGAGGYSGAGGDGGGGSQSLGNGTGGGYAGFLPASNSGGGAGGGLSRDGGGVGILGKGADGTAAGRVFSGGVWNYYAGTAGSTAPGTYTKTYGGGAAGGVNEQGGGGAVRIIWGTNRAFPSTNTADV